MLLGREATNEQTPFQDSGKENRVVQFLDGADEEERNAIVDWAIPTARDRRLKIEGR